MSQQSPMDAPSQPNYKESLNLPQTAFKMKAGAATREMEIEQFWEDERVYDKAQAARNKAHKFVLHDGPPYLSSDKIHIGTALNKILKDIVTRYKNQRGYYTPYVPGYDGHGLPIENAVVKNIKGGRHAITPVELRKRCREFAYANLKGQEANFRRLGVWGDWEHPYVTIDPAFEAIQAGVFGKMYEKGFVYKGLKPVYWCPHCETALADAEVEYADHTSHSIYVKFPIRSLERNNLPADFKAMLADAAFVIWTTTPWTLPANLALSVNPELDYHLLKSPWGKLIVAKDLVDAFAEVVLKGEELEEYKLIGSTETFEALAEFSGQEFELILARHPFIDRDSIVLTGDHVTLDAGTGVVHTAPGHGMEDYLIVQRYNQDKTTDLPILSPLDNRGAFTDEAQVPSLLGLFYEKGNAAVLEILREKEALLADSKFSHSYPHCWRCHNPVIYRATPQWFIDVDQFRQDALDAIEKVQWLPERGKNRIASMVEGRTDWCLSRQRVWGVPIPVFYCENNHAVVTPETTAKVVALFTEHSSDIWWEKSADEILQGAIACPDCGSRAFTKEMDIMDVWFDSGITHTAVVTARAEELGSLPVELYLEGSDQHRGWFQSALLTSVMVNPENPISGKAPYQSVLTHGFVLDQNGRKMSKSLGNVVDPNSVIREFGADILRLWVASVDYTNDVRIGKEIIGQLAEVYKKVRNTVRFLLGNLYDFNPATDRVPTDQLSSLDRYTLHRLQGVVQNLTEAFDQYEFHRYYQVLQNFCGVDLSAVYFDVTKDLLYCDAANSPTRRSAQTVLYEVLATLVPMLVPVMPHLAEDIWLSLPEQQRMTVNGNAPVSVVLLPWPEVRNEYVSDTIAVEFERLLGLRENVNQALERARAEGRIGSSLEADVAIVPLHEDMSFLKRLPVAELEPLLIVSNVRLLTETPKAGWLSRNDENQQVAVFVYPVSGDKCGRCWRYKQAVGTLAGHPQLCQRCYDAVNTYSTTAS